jgi:Na+-driven multidrug efflux pump
MVGTNIGARQYERARRITLAGGALAFGITQIIGLAAALFPGAWMGLFTTDPQALAMGSLYLQTVAPSYGAVGLGLALYFASQGTKRVLLPVLAGTVRMLLAGFFGWSAVNWLGIGIQNLFWLVAIAGLSYGLLTAVAVIPRRAFLSNQQDK